MSIADLAGRLAGDRLHVIVFGPGYGESIAVHIPGGGWLICDSLSRSHGATDFIPAGELLTHRQERAAMLLLSHPHDDHVGGFDRLVHRLCDGPVGLVGLHLPGERFTEDPDAERVVLATNRVKALAAISTHWQQYPERRWEMNADDAPRQLGDATLEVLHPNSSYLKGGQPDPAQAPNAYSTPVLIRWENVRIVLGADLPTPQWAGVLSASREVELADHGALKVSHHGSIGALPEQLVRAGDRDRLAVLTPWHRAGRLLPKLGAAGGIAWLLERRSAVSLTAPGRVLTAELPRPVTFTTFAGAIARRPLPGGAAVELKRSYDPDESWVAATFNDRGDLDAVDFGRAACVIVERELVSEAGPYPQR